MLQEGNTHKYAENHFQESEGFYLFRSLFPGKMTVFFPSSYARDLREGEEVRLSNGTVLDVGGWCLEFQETYSLL
jgi:hypothetical protein